LDVVKAEHGKIEIISISSSCAQTHAKVKTADEPGALAAQHARQALPRRISAMSRQSGVGIGRFQFHPTLPLLPRTGKVSLGHEETAVGLTLGGLPWVDCLSTPQRRFAPVALNARVCARLQPLTRRHQFIRQPGAPSPPRSGARSPRWLRRQSRSLFHLSSAFAKLGAGPPALQTHLVPALDVPLAARHHRRDARAPVRGPVLLPPCHCTPPAL